jgi:hypothetical protein
LLRHRSRPSKGARLCPAVGSYATSAPAIDQARLSSRNQCRPFGHATEMTGHVPETAGHDPENTGHALPKYAVLPGRKRRPDGCGVSSCAAVDGLNSADCTGLQSVAHCCHADGRDVASALRTRVCRRRGARASARRSHRGPAPNSSSPHRRARQDEASPRCRCHRPSRRPGSTGRSPSRCAQGAPGSAETS